MNKIAFIKTVMNSLTGPDRCLFPRNIIKKLPTKNVIKI